METKADRHIAQKSYAPSERLKSFMNDLLLLEDRKEERQRKISAGEKLSEGEIKEENEYRQRRRALDKRKSEILTEFIFPSMANLTKFFEYAANPRLREIFDKDIQALLFGSMKLTQHGSVFDRRTNEFVFDRFIDAIFACHLDPEGTPEDFRFALIDIVQNKISILFQGMGHPWLKDAHMYRHVLLPDMARAVAWTRFLAVKAYGNISFDKDRRPVLF